MKTILLIAGHGGLHAGAYATAGKRGQLPNGLTVFEGVTNREIKNMVLLLCEEAGFPVIDLVPEDADIGLTERVRRANALYAGNKDLIWMEIHLNAGGGSGLEVYTSVGQTKSDKIADVWLAEMAKLFPKAPIRKDMADGDADKENPILYTVKTVKCPAILTESFFMDHPGDMAILTSPEGKRKIARGHFNTIKRIHAEGL